MKKHILFQEFIEEVKNSRNRFISILLIVFLGVAFFAGIRAAGPDMRLSADSYYDSTSMMDVRVLGTLGLSNDDVTAISKVDGLENVSPHYSTDVFCNTSTQQLILHFLSISDTANKVMVTEGRMPVNADECLVDQSFLNEAKEYEIGDTITVTAQDDNLDELLHLDTYRIVGIGTHPYYMSRERGSSSIGSGEVSGLVMILPENFAMDYYTEITANVIGATQEVCYTDSYDELVEKGIDNLEAIEDVQCQNRYDSLLVEGNQKIIDGEAEIADAKQQLIDGKKEIEDGEKQLADAKKELSDKEKELADAKTTIASRKEDIADGWQQYNDGIAQYETNLAQLEASKPQLDSSESAISSAASQLENAWNSWNTLGRTQLDTLYASLAQVDASLANPNLTDDLRTRYEASRANIQTQIGKLEAQYNQLVSQQATYDSNRAQLDSGWATYNNGKAQLDNAKATLDSTKIQLEEGETALQEAEKEVTDGEQQLIDAKVELTTKEQELADGKKEYEEKSSTADEDIAKAEKRITNAKETLADLEEPSWYVLDRNSIDSSLSYGEDAERIIAIGNVFPVIFFLVAALICLTTMTRMVEENRTQIGTLKALGYTNSVIALKYIGYAFFATFVGGVIGAVFGQLLLPRVIMNAYSILYNNLPWMIAPIHVSYSLLGIGVACGCTLIATVAACFKETISSPAALMRPEAPKSGKRILLERITIIWKHLNFSMKATCRNLFRYKKRFFMTILGIGGCMGLILVGFGLKDSITAIGTLQYGEIAVYDGVLDLESDRSEASDENLHTFLDDDSNVDSYLSYHSNATEVTVGGVKKSAFLVIPENPSAFNNFVHLRGRTTHEPYSLSDEGVVISEKLSKLLDLSVGDTIQLKDGETGQVETTITAITENYFYHYVYMTPTLYETLFHETIDYDNMYISLENTSDEAEERFRQEAMEQDAVSGVSFVTKIASRVADMLKSMDTVIYVLVISAGLLAFVVLYNLNNINISERKRELATLKVLGFYDGEVSNYVFRENILLTIIGCVVGLLFGYFLHRFVIVTVEIDIMMFGRDINWISYVYSIGLTFVFSLLVNVATHFKLKKIDMVESLKSVE